MALFDRLSEHQALNLLRVGFAARLRSEVADIFVTAHPDGKLMRVDERTEATVFFFQSGDTNIKLRPNGDLPHSAFCIALAQHPSDSHSDPLFLHVTEKPDMQVVPALLKLSLHSATPRRTLFTFASAGPHPRYLTLRGVTRGDSVLSTLNVCKYATFHLEIIADTIGKGFMPHMVTKETPYIYPSQALTHALLQLNIRFRLTSVHNSFLASGSSSTETSTQALAMVHRDAPSNKDKVPIVFTPFLIAAPIPEALPASRFSSLVCTDAPSSSTMSLYIPHLSLSGQDPALHPCTGEKISVCVNALLDAWGAVSIGSGEGGITPGISEISEAKKEDMKFLWLTAGPRGKVETRPNRRNWEIFFIEFVEQSFAVAFKELPIPQLYTIADQQTRAGIRAAIEKSISSSSTLTPSLSKSNTERSRGFNHAAALTGLSDNHTGSSSRADVSVNQQQRVPTPQAKRKGKQSQALPSAASTTVLTEPAKSKLPHSKPTLPRNVTSKKANKRNRRKNKGMKATSAEFSSTKISDEASAGRNTLNEGANAHGKSRAENTSPSDESPTLNPNDEGSSSSSTTPSASLGPLCAACGRSTTGPYTKAMGKHFHPQCFCCGRCRRPMGIGGGQFRERGGIPYCEACYASHIAARCARCAQPILETVITAMDKTWHKNCLTCTICRLPVTETFWLYADKPNEPRCSRCVTGEEHSTIRRGSNRMVNLPGLGANNSRSLLGSGMSNDFQTLSDHPHNNRARLHNPSFSTMRR